MSQGPIKPEQQTLGPGFIFKTSAEFVPLQQNTVDDIIQSIHEMFEALPSTVRLRHVGKLNFIMIFMDRLKPTLPVKENEDGR